MQSPSQKITPQYAVNECLSDSYVKIAEEKSDFNFRIHEIWEKVKLLEYAGYITSESEKFNIAYRFTAMQLERVYQENCALKARLSNI
ncbi:hypothetical protein Q0590_30955 [Rhodocytophaga aerolata]|uniref:Phage protein n=1 Tax=Rhodocytophaga aerolata TaxID=455078 RepID=A0ABT8RHT7_9BACT|nr:hypothetical protein [Rhodocytophaga aerolata]MDO1450733.1 hypothetical protein [Rhodocytophaga aerolata]